MEFCQKIKVKKVLIGKAEHYYVKVGVGLFSIENQEVTIGDKILISGPTTGNQEIIVEKMFVNGSENILAKVGDKPNPILLAIISITPSKFEFLFIEQVTYDRCSQVIENIEVIALRDFSGDTWCVLIGFIPR